MKILEFKRQIIIIVQLVLVALFFIFTLIFGVPVQIPWSSSSPFLPELLFFHCFLFVIGCWIGIVFIIGATVQLYKNHVKNAASFELLGICSIGINLAIFFITAIVSGSFFHLSIGFFIDSIIWIAFVIILVSLTIENDLIKPRVMQQQSQTQQQQQQQQQDQKQKVIVNIQNPTQPQKQPTESETKYCSSCGDKIKKTASFCEHCGAQQ